MRTVLSQAECLQSFILDSVVVMLDITPYNLHLVRPHVLLTKQALQLF